MSKVIEYILVKYVSCFKQLYKFFFIKFYFIWHSCLSGMHVDPFRPNNQNCTLPSFVNSKENIWSLLKDTNRKHLVLIYIGKTLYNFIFILLYIYR